MSTYKSLGGPPSGLIVSNDSELMQIIDAIAFPGLTANFDAAKSAALAVTLLDWREHGHAYAETMVKTSRALASELQEQGLPVFTVEQDQQKVATDSHQFAIQAVNFGGGQAMAKQLRQANLLNSGIGLPIAEIEGDMNGLRLGTPEMVRSGMSEQHMKSVAGYIADSILERRAQVEIAKDVTQFRSWLDGLEFIYE